MGCPRPEHSGCLCSSMAAQSLFQASRSHSGFLLTPCRGFQVFFVGRIYFGPPLILNFQAPPKVSILQTSLECLWSLGGHRSRSWPKKVPKVVCERVSAWLQIRFQENTWKWEFDALIVVFQPCSQEDDLLDQIWVPNLESQPIL